MSYLKIQTFYKTEINKFLEKYIHLLIIFFEANDDC